LRRYETVFILRPDLGETQVKETIKRFEGIVGTGGGELIETDEWGSRELAYRIRNERRGFYVRLDYTAPSAGVSEVERNLKLSDGVLRYLSVMMDEEADAAAAREEIAARKRRAEEARIAAEHRAAAAATAAQAPAAPADVPDAPEDIQGEGANPEPSGESSGGERQG
jgi:small subunit ribosomal protein S6